MRFNPLILTGFVLALCTLGCSKKAETGPAKVDPHSAEGIMLSMHDQAKQFSDALERKDYQYLHDYGYYFIGIIVAFNAKLDAAERQSLKAPIKELLDLSNQLDRAGGGQHAAAAEAVVKRIQAVVNDLDQQFQQGKTSEQGKPPR